MPQKCPKMTQSGPKWPKYDPKWPKMAQNGPRMTQIDPKWPENDPKWPTITPNGPKMTAGFTHFFQEHCEPISLSLERALSSEIGSQDPCSARSATPALQHFMLLWHGAVFAILAIFSTRGVGGGLGDGVRLCIELRRWLLRK